MSGGGVIFDLDGTLIASETIYLRAWHDAARETGESMSDELYVRLMGFNRADTIVQLGATWGSTARAKRFVDLAQEYYEKRSANDGHAVRPGIRPLLDHLEAGGAPLAVATSSTRRLAAQTLAEVGLADYFKVVVGGDEVARGKPDPEIYLLAATRLGIAPDRSLAFEDTTIGATAALAAGLGVVLVPELADDDFPPLDRVRRFPDHAKALAWLQQERGEIS